MLFLFFLKISVRFERVAKTNISIVYGFDNLQLFSLRRLDDQTTPQNIDSTESLADTTLETTIETTLEVTTAYTTSTSAILTSTTTTMDMSTSAEPIKKLIYFCDFDNFENDGGCEGAELSSTNIEQFGALKYMFIKDTPYFLTDITSISIIFYLNCS